MSKILLRYLPILMTAALLILGIGIWIERQCIPLPPIVEQYVPGGKEGRDCYRAEKIVKPPPPVREIPPVQPREGTGSNNHSDERYTFPIPASIAVADLKKCLATQKSPFVEGADYAIIVTTEIVRAIAMTNPNSQNEAAAAFAACRSKLVGR